MVGIPANEDFILLLLLYLLLLLFFFLLPLPPFSFLVDLLPDDLMIAYLHVSVSFDYPSMWVKMGSRVCSGLGSLGEAGCEEF